MALRLVLIVSYSALVTYTTSPVQFTDGLSILLKPFNKVGFPVQQFTIIISIALRFIPIIALEADKIIKAQISRGANLENSNIVKKIYSILPIVTPLLISSIKKADDLAVAMETRCFNSNKRSKMKKLFFTKYDFTAGFIIIIYLILYYFLT
jgi:energy-coupling factor transport system permease protein